MTTLDTIQRLQFTDRAAAEAMLACFLRDELGMEPAKIELRPLAVSLNSFNGFLIMRDGSRLFFKTHTEADTVITEFYNAEQLAEAGYPVLKPIYSSTETGRQLLIYPVVDEPSVFDVAWAIDNGQMKDFEGLTKAQRAADDRLYQCYARTLATSSAEESAAAPIHQLFYHRMAGGRMVRYYGEGRGSDLPLGLPDGGSVSLCKLREAAWSINGQEYAESINEIIERALRLLHPAQPGPSVIGHGDAHNGNLFYQRERQSLMYFDPAFAGRHSPLLDLAKPLFHNVFAMWMYYPHDKADQLHLTAHYDQGRLIVKHDYWLSDVRRMFLTSKIERVLLPTLRMLRESDALRDDWRDVLKAALFCCPFLTMNLADQTRFPPSIQVLGFSMAVEMGAESASQRSVIDRTLDGVAEAL